MEEKKRKKWISAVLIICILAALAAVPLVITKKAEEAESTAIIVSTQAEYRNIDDCIIGGGQLESEGSSSVKIPENIKLESYLVANGDRVSAGDPMAVVDRVSVMSAISEVQETLQELSSRINDASGSSDSGTITTKVAGTVKKIYAQAGDSVEDVMLRYGALAVISLDGRMCAGLETDVRVAVSDTVTVFFRDGSSVKGTVKSNINGTVKIVIDDKGYEPGTEVAVYTDSGTALGSTKLEVYNAWNVTAYAGTVSAVKVSEGKTVSEGQTVFRVTGLGNPAEYQRLIDTRQKYEELMQELFILYKDGVVTAPCDGIVSGVNGKGAWMLAYEQEESDGFRIVFLSGEGGAEYPAITTQSLPEGTIGVMYAAGLQAVLGTETVSGSWLSTELPAGLSLDEASGLLSGTPSNPGSFTVTVSFTYNSQTVTKDFTIIINPTLSGETYSAYPAIVTEVAGDVIKVLQGTEAYALTDPDMLPWVEPDITQLTEENSYFGAMITPGEHSEGDLVWLIFDSEERLVKVSRAGSDDPSGGGNPFNPGGSGGGFGGFSVAGGFPQAGAEVEDDGLYSLEKTDVAAVTSQENMRLTITVDELDITKIYVGQEAEITMNSLPSEKAMAFVREISNSGENSGGNTKFSVELELEKSSNMLPGMNATATITLGTAENALCIPAAALYEKNGECYVYTAFDEKSGKLLNPVTVETGAADADYVEIISRLKEGDRIFYEYYDNAGNLLST